MKFIAGVLFMLIFLPGCKGAESPLPVVGRQAPGFDLKTIDGRQIQLNRLSGNVIILDFWATWCAPCKESTREMEQLHRRYRDRGLVVIGISMDKGVAAVKDFAARHRLTYIIALDDGSASRAYGITRIPVTYVLNREHVIMQIYPGYGPGMGDRLRAEVERLL